MLFVPPTSSHTWGYAPRCRPQNQITIFSANCQVNFFTTPYWADFTIASSSRPGRKPKKGEPDINAYRVLKEWKPQPQEISTLVSGLQTGKGENVFFEIQILFNWIFASLKEWEIVRTKIISNKKGLCEK